MRRSLLIILLLFLSLSLVRAQYYDTGQEPASFRWKKLKSYHFTFIYPESYSDQINKVVLVFEKAYDLLKGSYNEPILDHIPVIIHNHTVNSNGYVAWAPKRIELYPFPGQDNLPLDHIEQLALHELMHVLQFSSFRRGISRPLSFLFGEQYTGALGIYTPMWFLEGEAVIAESIYTLSGRGRTPVFEKRLKALLLENNKIFSYDKMLNGSYRDFTPDYYKYGYQLDLYARQKFGGDIWKKAMDNTAYRPYSLNPFNQTLKKYTGLKKEDLYYETMVELRRKWKEEEDLAQTDSYTTINSPKGKDYLNYYSPVYAGKDSIIAIRTSLSDVPQFVLIKQSDRSENKLFTPGYLWPYNISYSKGLIAWAENSYDPRWENREYSVIKIYDLNSRKSRTLSPRGRYFSPSLSPDGKLLACVESSDNYENYLCILETEYGNTVEKIETPNNFLAIRPVWTGNGEDIVMISYSEKGEGIVSYNYKNGLWQTHLDYGRDDIQSVCMLNNEIYYISSESGTDNIMKLDDKGQKYRVSSSRFGASDISKAGTDLLFTDYDASGNSIAHFSSSDIKSEPFIKGDSRFAYIDSLLANKGILSTPQDLSLPSGYKEEKFRKGLDLFRLHSWMPFYADVMDVSISDLKVSPGLMLISQNHLSSLISTLGYSYSEKEHFLKSAISWKGWYPAIDFDISWGGTPAIIQDGDSEATPSVLYPGMQSNTTLYIPLHFRNSRFTQTLWPSVNIRYKNNYIYDNDARIFDYGQTLINSRLYLSNTYRMASRDIYPRFGQVLDIYHTRSLFDDDLYGPVTSVRSAFYFPGIFRNNGLRLRLGYEIQEFRHMLIYNRLSFPRGYKHIVARELSSLSVDYAFALMYPDFNLGQFIYINRIRNTLFYDFSKGYGIYRVDEHNLYDGSENFSAAGTELLADFYILRLPFRFSAGLQTSYMPFEKDWHFGFLFNIDVYGFVLNR